MCALAPPCARPVRPGGDAVADRVACRPCAATSFQVSSLRLARAERARRPGVHVGDVAARRALVEDPDRAAGVGEGRVGASAGRTRSRRWPSLRLGLDGHGDVVQRLVVGVAHAHAQLHGLGDVLAAAGTTRRRPRPGTRREARRRPGARRRRSPRRARPTGSRRRGASSANVSAARLSSRASAQPARPGGPRARRRRAAAPARPRRRRVRGGVPRRPRRSASLIGADEDPTENGVRRFIARQPRPAGARRVPRPGRHRRDQAAVPGPRDAAHARVAPPARPRSATGSCPPRAAAASGTTAVSLLVDWAFDALELERIEITTTPDNAAARALASSLGFRRRA